MGILLLHSAFTALAGGPPGCAQASEIGVIVHAASLRPSRMVAAIWADPRSLPVGVDQQHAVPGRSPGQRDLHRQGGLADTALRVADRDTHGAASLAANTFRMSTNTECRRSSMTFT
jgi:hypothetical protein